MNTPQVDPRAYYFEAPPFFLAPAAAPEAPRTFTGVALSGAPMVHPTFGPLVIDLGSLNLPAPCPVLRNHVREEETGLCTFQVVDHALQAAGTLLTNEYGTRVASAADQGFPWQLSVHAVPGIVETIGAGARVPVNGRTVDGPLTIWRQTAIRELSFTPTGVDRHTSAHVFSTPATDPAADPAPLTPIEALPMADAPNESAAQVAALTAQLAALQTRADTAEQALQAERQAQRTQAVQALFSELGLPVPAQRLPYYMALDPDAFAAFATDLRTARQPDPTHLFSEQAVSGLAADRQRADDALVERMAKL